MLLSEAHRSFMTGTDGEREDPLGQCRGVLAVGLVCALAGVILEQVQTVLEFPLQKSINI